MPWTEARASSAGYDVVVVGARCAGAATAMLLARAGHRVLMIDRGRYGTDTLSTHALMRGAVVQLHRFDVLPAVVAAGTPAIRQATFFYGDEAVPVPIKPRDGIDALYAPRRYVLDRLLVETPHEEAIEADAEITALAVYVDRAERGDFCREADVDGYDNGEGIPSRVLIGPAGEGAYRK